MINELERVYLTEDLATSPFVKGDVATVVFIYPDGKGCELEFFALDGSTLGVETAAVHQVRSVKGIKKMLHIDEAV